MARSPRPRALSEPSHARPSLKGLGIEFFPVYNSPTYNLSTTVPHSTDRQAPKPCPSISFPQIDARRRNPSVPSMVKQVAHMRSMKGMEGLLDAEYGGSMVEFDPFTTEGGSGFKAGQRIGPAPVSMATPSTRIKAPRNRSATVSGASLLRSGTFFSLDATPSRKSVELKTLLSNSGRKASAKLILVPPCDNGGSSLSSTPTRSKIGPPSSTQDIGSIVLIEKAKARARVEVDIELESDVVVEGGHLRGKMRVCIRAATKNEQPIWIGGGKLRIIGFEGLPTGDTRYMFYQHSELLSKVTRSHHLLFTSEPDNTGFCLAREGDHTLFFSMPIPVQGPGGRPKGSFHSRNGPSIRYIVMGSLKIKENASSLSMAHFYRNIEVFPLLGIDLLRPAPQSVQASTSQAIFMGGSGKLKLAVSLHRQSWVAGQNCYVSVTLENQTTKKVKTLTFTVICTTVFFKPKVELDALMVKSPMSADMDACQTSTARKEVAQTILGMGQRGEKGTVTAKGFWTGVDSEQKAQLSHMVLLPVDALSIPRGRLVEVKYDLTVSAGFGALSTEVKVCVPLRIISFLSIDPPPGPRFSDSLLLRSTDSAVQRRSAVRSDLGSSIQESEHHSPSLERGDVTGVLDGMPDSTLEATSQSFLRAFPLYRPPQTTLPGDPSLSRTGLDRIEADLGRSTQPGAPSRIASSLDLRNRLETDEIHENSPEPMNDLCVSKLGPNVTFQLRNISTFHQDRFASLDGGSSQRESWLRECDRGLRDTAQGVIQKSVEVGRPNEGVISSPTGCEPCVFLPVLVAGKALRNSTSHQGMFANNLHRYDIQDGRIPGLPKLSSSKSFSLVARRLSKLTPDPEDPTGETLVSHNSTNQSKAHVEEDEPRSTMKEPLAQETPPNSIGTPILTKRATLPNTIRLCVSRNRDASLDNVIRSTSRAEGSPSLPSQTGSNPYIHKAKSISKSDSSGLSSKSSRWSSSTTNSISTNGMNLSRESSASSFSDASSSVRMKVAQLEAKDRAMRSIDSSPSIRILSYPVPLVRSHTFQVSRGERYEPKMRHRIRGASQLPVATESVTDNLLNTTKAGSRLSLA